MSTSAERQLQRMGIEPTPRNIGFVDWLESCIGDSFDIDWTATDGALAIVQSLQELGIFPAISAQVEQAEIDNGILADTGHSAATIS